MTFDKAQAGADLAAIDGIVERVRRSRIYRVSGDLAIFWGVVQFLQFIVSWLSPANGDWSWVGVDLVGVAVTAWMLRRALPAGRSGASVRRALGGFALFYGFGFVWTVLLGHYGARETAVFWHTFFLFGYCLAGLWFGVGFLVIGLGLSASVVAVYLFVAPPLFGLLIALVASFGYILCGLWMRRA